MKLNFASAPISLTSSLLSKTHYYSFGSLTVAVWILSHWILRLLDLHSRLLKWRYQNMTVLRSLSESLTQEKPHVVDVEVLLVWKPSMNGRNRVKGRPTPCPQFWGQNTLKIWENMGKHLQIKVRILKQTDDNEGK